MEEATQQENPFSIEEFAAPVLAAVAAMDSQSIGKELTRFIGYDEARAMYAWQDAFESMRPERLLGLYVLAQTLNDIEPLDSEPDASWSLKRKLDHARHQQARRFHRVAHHQKIEQELRAEGLALKADYRNGLRLISRDGACEVKGTRGRHAIRGGKLRTREALRQVFNSHWSQYQKRREDLDLTNTTLEYVLRDRVDVRLWCDVADVNEERFYRAVERRLLLKGRCSIELYRLLEDFRRGKDRNGPTHVDLLARHELRAYG